MADLRLAAAKVTVKFRDRLGFDATIEQGVQILRARTAPEHPLASFEGFVCADEVLIEKAAVHQRSTGRVDYRARLVVRDPSHLHEFLGKRCSQIENGFDSSVFELLLRS